MDCQQLTTCESRVYLNVDMLEPEVFELAGGSVAVLSARKPEKTTANQDAAAVVAAGENAAVLIVADGCGGMANGEQAARIAIDCLTNHIAAAAAAGESLRTAILDAVEQANRQIIDLKNGAGATLAVVQIENGEARPYHIGDAQIVMVGGRGKVKLLTTSHSPVGYAMEAGMLEEQEALDHEERHLVSNYLGSEAMHVEVGSVRERLDPRRPARGERRRARQPADGRDHRVPQERHGGERGLEDCRGRHAADADGSRRAAAQAG